MNNIASLITRRRLQVLVHSLLYYAIDTNLVTDTQWTAWAKELAYLQKQNPEIAARCVYAKAFEDFEGASGFNLPYTDSKIVRIARDLLIEVNDNEALDRLGRVVQTDYDEKSYKKLKKKEEKSVGKIHKGLFF